MERKWKKRTSTRVQYMFKSKFTIPCNNLSVKHHFYLIFKNLTIQEIKSILNDRGMTTHG